MMFIKYAVNFIFQQDTQQTAYNLLAHGGQLALALPLVAKKTGTGGSGPDQIST